MSGAQARILVVDDEPYIVDLLDSALRMADFEVCSADSGAAALAAAALRAPDVVILDVMLPDIDGFTVARRLRDLGSTAPVLFLTARDAVEDRLAGLAAGGDDYVSKPFSLAEVVVRLQAILRRTRAAAPAEPGCLLFEDLRLDVDAHTVERGGQPIWLSAKEFALLHYLVLNAGKVVSKRQILHRLWDEADGGPGRLVENFISRLRAKIDVHGAPLIHTVRGVGYTLRSSS
jgi:two-component system, OmpR family, response regulator